MKPLSSLPDASVRARANFIAYCPLCTYCGISDMPDVMVRPSFRRQAPTRLYPVEHWSLHRCCSLSQDAPWQDTQAEVSRWWNDKRQQPISNPAADNRRRNCLAKLGALDLEPITCATQGCVAAEGALTASVSEQKES